LAKLIHNFFRGIEVAKSFGYFCKLKKKLSKENDRPMCENSANLATLVGFQVAHN
jgi:hypothetical protein